MMTFELRAFARDHVFHQGKLAPGGPGSAEFFTAFYGTEGTLIVDTSAWTVYTKESGDWADRKGVGRFARREFPRVHQDAARSRIPM